MKTNQIKLVLCTILLLTGGMGIINQAEAQSHRATGTRGYATDGFEGFDAIDKDTRIPQKSKSFWYSISCDNPQAQFEHGVSLEESGRLNKARKAHEALVREWPVSTQAVQSQLAIARIREKTRKFEKAFDEYQYLLVHYAGNCPYNEILTQQFRIANHLLHDNRSMFGWLLNSPASVRERFEQIVRNAPRSAIAPEVMLIVGSLYITEKEPQQAIAAYSSLMNRFPGSPQAESAAFLAARCRYQLATRYAYNELQCREAIAFFKSLLHRLPNHPQKEEMHGWYEELQTLLIEQNYQQALFYDSRTRKREAAIAAYKRFLSEFSETKYAPVVKERLAALEAGAPPPK